MLDEIVVLFYVVTFVNRIIREDKYHSTKVYPELNIITSVQIYIYTYDII